MILTAEDIQKYVPLQTSSFDFANYQGFEFRALYKHFPRLLGTSLFNAIISDNPEAWIPNPDNSGSSSGDGSGNGSGDETPAQELIRHIVPVLANLAVLEAIPFFDVVLTSNGFGVVRNNNIAPASVERVTAFAQGCQNAANDFSDILLLYLEDNATLFTMWNSCSINSGSLITNTTAFNTATRLNLKRHQFIDMKMHLYNIENTTLSQAISSEFLQVLAAGNDTLVKPLFQKALAFLAYDSYMASFSMQPDIARPYFLVGSKWMARALSVLNANRASYPLYVTHGYEAPYDNDLDGTSGFFIAGAH